MEINILVTVNKLKVYIDNEIHNVMEIALVVFRYMAILEHDGVVGEDYKVELNEVINLAL